MVNHSLLGEVTMHIDIHCHIYPNEYVNLIKQEGARFGVEVQENSDGDRKIIVKGLTFGNLQNFTDVDLRLKKMEEMGLDMNILSFSSNPGVYWADSELANELCKVSNDAYAKIIKERPEKFAGFAALPAQDGNLSSLELERSVKELGLKGGFLGTNVNGRYLDHECFFPIYEKAASLKVPIIVHPANPAGMSEMKDYYLFNLVGFTTESANSIGRLIFSGIFDRLPDLKFIFLHGGGTAPYLAGRFMHGWKVRKECQNIQKSPLEYMKSNFYFDCLLFHSPVVRFLVDLIGSDRIMLGTDLPYDMTDEQIVKTLENAGLSSDEYDNISHKNAQTILNL